MNSTSTSIWFDVSPAPCVISPELVLAPLAKQERDAFDAELVELVERTQDDAALCGVDDASRLHDPVENLATVDADHILAARRASGLHRFGGDGDHFSVGGRPGHADRVSVALDEFAEAERARLLVAPDRTGRIAAERLRDALPVLGHIARQRSSMIVAQGDPLLVIVLKREDAFVGTIGVGQKLAESVDIFERAGVEGIEAPALVNRADGIHEPAFSGDDCRCPVRKAPRFTGFRALLLVRRHDDHPTQTRGLGTAGYPIGKAPATRGHPARNSSSGS